MQFSDGLGRANAELQVSAGPGRANPEMQVSAGVGRANLEMQFSAGPGCAIPERQVSPDPGRANVEMLVSGGPGQCRPSRYLVTSSCVTILAVDCFRSCQKYVPTLTKARVPHRFSYRATKHMPKKGGLSLTELAVGNTWSVKVAMGKLQGVQGNNHVHLTD